MENALEYEMAFYAIETKGNESYITVKPKQEGKYTVTYIVPEHTTFTFIKNKEIQFKIERIMHQYVTEMEGYSFFGSNPGIPVDDIEEIAHDIVEKFNF